MRYLAVIMSMLICAAPVHAERLNQEEIITIIAYELLHIVDAGTTLNIADEPGRYREMNPILGESPNREAVYAWMIGTAILYPIVTYLLPRSLIVFDMDIQPRRTFQALSIGVAGGCVFNNLSIGLTMDF